MHVSTAVLQQQRIKQTYLRRWEDAARAKLEFDPAERLGHRCRHHVVRVARTAHPCEAYLVGPNVYTSLMTGAWLRLAAAGSRTTPLRSKRSMTASRYARAQP